MALPDTIERQHVLSAIEELDETGPQTFGRDPYRDLFYNGGRYPPETVVRIAARIANGHELAPESISGSEVAELLRRHGFSVIEQTGLWSLRPGDKIRRTLLHTKYGGSRQSGISPSAQTPNILIFTDPASGEQHGYYDTWTDDGVLLYSGEGQKGDQVLRAGNLAISNHVVHGKALRVFKGSGGDVEYVGEFEVDRDEPLFYAEAHESGQTRTKRRVIVFRLIPLDRLSDAAVAEELVSTIVPCERQRVPATILPPRVTPVEVRRREAELLTDYQTWLERMGLTFGRLECRIRDSNSILRSDLYCESRNILVEAKGIVTREAIRMAIGQLYDYRRFRQSELRLAVLVPHFPGKDLERLLRSADIDCIWRVHDRFDDNARGFFTRAADALT
jgi:hypothetical protein